MLKPESQCKIFSLCLTFFFVEEKNTDVYIIFFYVLKKKNGIFFCKAYMAVFFSVGCLD